MTVETAASFAEFCTSAAAGIAVLAKKFALPREEVQQTAYLAWREALGSYDAKHSSKASFKTYTLAIVDRMLLATDAHHRLVSLDAAPEGAEPRYEGYALEGLTVYERVAEQASSPAENQVHEMLTQYIEELALPDLLQGHPVFAHPAYRVLLEATAAGEKKSQIARRLGVSERRVYQLLFEVERIIRKRDIFEQDALIHLDDTGTAQSDPVRFRLLSGLTFSGTDALDLDEVLRTTQLILRHGQVWPVVVDQFSRVLREDTVCAAAGLLGLRHVKTVLFPVLEGERRSDDSFQRLKEQLSPATGRPRYELGVIDSIERRVRAGMVSPLVATRLAHLPQRAQEHVAGQLGGLMVALLSIEDANHLVAAYDHARDQAEAPRFNAALARKAQEVAHRLSVTPRSRKKDAAERGPERAP